MFALGCLYVSWVLMMGSGFIFGDIDHTELQRQTAERKSLILSLVAALAFFLSLGLLFLSSVVSRLLLRIIGIDRTS